MDTLIIAVTYIVDEPVSQVKEGDHSAPVNAICEDAPCHREEDILGTVGLHGAI